MKGVKTMWLSIQGIYEYDPTVFDGFDSPSYTDPDNNVHVLNKNDVINSICLECAELELLYPSVEMMKFAIGVWSASNYDAFCKMYASQLIKYNPIWNVDADETVKLQHGHTETRTPNLTDTRTPNLTDTRTPNLTDTRTPNLTDTQRPDITNTESVQGFNSSLWSESKKVVESGSITLEQHGTETLEQHGTETDVHTGTDTMAHTGTDTMAHTGTDTMAHTGMDTTTIRRTGNIGVTASQDLIKKEREVADFSTIKFITKSFKERFCLLIY